MPRQVLTCFPPNSDNFSSIEEWFFLFWHIAYWIFFKFCTWVRLKILYIIWRICNKFRSDPLSSMSLVLFYLCKLVKPLVNSSCKRSLVIDASWSFNYLTKKDPCKCHMLMSLKKQAFEIFKSWRAITIRFWWACCLFFKSSFSSCLSSKGLLSFLLFTKGMTKSLSCLGCEGWPSL